MNPAHRDRIAFIRICSGKFKKGMEVHHIRSKKLVKLAQPQQFLAQDRVVVEEAYPGDIIGLHDPGIFSIGDTICQDNSKIQYKDIPAFAPEHFAKVYGKDSMKRKQFVKGIQQLSEEGAIQVFKRPDIGTEELIIGVVGVLQFEVLEYRLEKEYNVEIRMQSLPYRYIRWVEMEDFDYDRFSLTMDSLIAQDKREQPVVLFQNQWSIQKVEERNPKAVLNTISTKS